MNLGEVWARLEEDHPGGAGAGRIQRRIVPDSRRDFFLALELPSRNRMLILRTSPSSVVAQASVPESRGVRVRISNRATDPPAAEVELALVDRQHQDIFDLLIEDLVEAAEQPEDERAGVSAFLARLTDWQHLLMRLAPGVMSRENQQGLWGELWTLREIVAPVVGFASGVRGWRGPLGADQDFQLPHSALEVKTSTAHRFERLGIASERQLDVVPAGVPLGVVALVLDARPDSGETLAAMVRESLSTALAVGCGPLLEERLTLYGYRTEDTENYSGTGYAVRFRLQWRVREDFPRIVVSDLKPGVGEVKYSVSVAACAPFRMSEEGLANLLRGDYDHRSQ